MSPSQLHFDELREIQETHLAVWKTKLLPEIYAEVSDYVLSQNQCPNSLTEKSRVFRGQDIVQIIFDWPNLSPAYPPRINPEDDCI